MKIGLINPRMSHNRARLSTSLHKRWVPNGLATVAAWLKGAGHQVWIIDANYYDWTPQSIAEQISTKDFDAIGITTFLDSFPFLEEGIPLIKQAAPGVPVILGGPLVSSAPELVMQNCQADIAVLGEGDKTALELFWALENHNSNLASLKGICFKNTNGGLCFTEPQPPIVDLDTLPYLALKLFPIHGYLQTNQQGGAYHTDRYLVIITSRGCEWGKCKFCLTPKLFPGYREQSIHRVVEEIKFYQRRYQISAVHFRDDTMSPERAMLLGQQMARIGIRYSLLTRIDLVPQLDLRFLRETGCQFLRVGIESIDPALLRAMNKGITTEQTIEAISKIRKHGIDIKPFFVIGYPGEMKESLRATEKFIHENKFTYATITFYIPLPGLPAFEEAVQTGIIKNKLKFLRKLQHYQNIPPVNMTDGISDQELIDFKKRILALRNQ